MTDTALAAALAVRDNLQGEISRVIEGHEAALQYVLTALIAGGHILLEGVPGVAKTLLVRCLSAALDVSFSRIQFTPDLLPADILGVNIFDAEKAEFRFRPGPLFGDIILADEINRAPAKTQAALLEAMQEQRVSIDGDAHHLSDLFMVAATQNPIEYEGTYPLPEAQLDRFLMKVVMAYPSEEAERAMLLNMHELGERIRHPTRTIRRVATPDDLRLIRRCAYQTEVDRAVLDYIVAIVRQSRALPSLALGASPRAGVMLLQACRALATLRGKTYVTPDEVQELAYPVLRHRIRLTPEAELEGLTPDSCLETLLQQVAIPR
jgi:MoxR-like ATPase